MKSGCGLSQCGVTLVLTAELVALCISHFCMFNLKLQYITFFLPPSGSESNYKNTPPTCAYIIGSASVYSVATAVAVKWWINSF